MGEPLLPVRESFSYLGLSLSHSSSRPSSFLSATPKMYKFQGNCPRYTIRTDNRDRSREIVGEREKPEKPGFTLDPIHRLFQLRTSIGWIKKSPISFNFRISSRTVPLRLRKVSSPSRKISLLVLPARSTLADEKKME